MDSPEYETLLSADDKCEAASEESVPYKAVKPRCRRVPNSLLINLILIVMYTTASLVIIRANTVHCGDRNRGTEFHAYIHINTH